MARVEPTAPPLDHERAIRTFFYCLLGIELFFALVNFAFVPHESPGPAIVHALPSTSASAAPLSPWREVLRFIKHQLDLDREANLTTWFSSAQLALAGLAALVLSHLRRDRRWIWVSLGLFYLSADELAMIHEWVGSQMWRSNWKMGFVVAPYPWVVLLGPVLIGFAIWMLRLISTTFADEPRVRKLAWAGLGVMALSLPLEVIGGRLESVSAQLLRVETTLEETAELVGATLLLVGLLTALAPPGRRVEERSTSRRRA